MLMIMLGAVTPLINYHLSVYPSMILMCCMVFMEFCNLPISLNSWSGGPYAVSNWLLLLSVWGSFAALISSKFILSVPSRTKLSGMVYFLNLILMASFTSVSYFEFYVFFELSLVPIVMIILGWGYQPERLGASLSMVIYTLTASLPLLLIILSLFYTQNTFNIGLVLSGSTVFIPSKSYLCMMLILGMLVKLPIFGGHLWLPKAHVEAPMEGSMILASIMLKLGGYGLILVAPLGSLMSVSYVTMAVGLFGGLLISILSIRQNDLKVLIAYSSVAHMGVALAAIMAYSSMGNLSGVGMLFAHGFTSSALFLGGNFLYSTYNSRNLLIAKGSLKMFPMFTLFWFVVALSNMGGPPTLNLFSEIFIFVAISWKQISFLLPASLIAGFSTVFTLSLFTLSTYRATTFSLKPFVTLEVSDLISWGFHLMVISLSLFFVIMI